MADTENAKKTDDKVPVAVTPGAAVTPPAAGAAPAGRPTTCAQCSKRLSRKQHYYRNGRFFCNKRCWRTSATGAPPQPAAAA